MRCSALGSADDSACPCIGRCTGSCTRRYNGDCTRRYNGDCARRCNGDYARRNRRYNTTLVLTREPVE